MKKLAFILGFSILGCSLTVPIHADEHGGVHIHLPCGENVEDDPCGKLPPVCMELKPWYHNQHFDEYENIEAQADRLQDDTAWPGQREDFSDFLLR